MERISLTVTKRDVFRKGPMHRLRALGKIPGVIYGHGLDTIPVTIDARTINTIIRKHTGRNFMFSLVLEGDNSGHDHWTIIREAQRDPVTRDLIHVDFYEMKKDESIKIAVPVHFVGTPIGVRAGGFFEPLVRDVEVQCLPKDIPEFLEVNIENLNIGDAIYLSELKLENIEFVADEAMPIASVIATRGTIAEEAPKEEGEVAEPELVGGKGKAEKEEE